MGQHREQARAADNIAEQRRQDEANRGMSKRCLTRKSANPSLAGACNDVAEAAKRDHIGDQDDHPEFAAARIWQNPCYRRDKERGRHAEQKHRLGIFGESVSRERQHRTELLRRHDCQMRGKECHQQRTGHIGGEDRRP